MIKQKKFRQLVLNFAWMGSLASLTACGSNTQFSKVAGEAAATSVNEQSIPSAGAPLPPPPKNEAELAMTCQNATQLKKTVKVNFPKPSRTCEWGVNGNLGPRDQYLQARIEQTVTFDLPKSSSICDMDFKFPKQNFLYDDHFLFTFNKTVLASSYWFDPLFGSRASGQNHFVPSGTYSWSSIAGSVWDHNKEGTFCLSSKSSLPGSVELTKCSWPMTDTQGQIEVDLPKHVIQKIIAKDLTSNIHEFSFVSLGDNDDMDCEHSDINFEVEVSYIQSK